VREMSSEEIHDFLTAGTRTGKIAVVRKDGSPMVVPIWFDVDDDGTVVFTTGQDSTKARAMRRDPRVSICIDREEPLYDFVRIDGTAELSDDPELLARWAHRVGGRYMGPDLAAAYGARNAVPGELVVRVTPTRIVAQADIAASPD
jgi:PPOX class probable F420-dependent enzyme